MDPLTMYLIGTGASLGAQAISSGIQGYQGRKEAKKAESMEAELRAQGMPKMETPEEYFDLYEKAKEGRASQIATEQAQQNLATISDTLATAGGARGLIGGLTGAARKTTQDIYGIQAQQEQSELKALESLAQAQQYAGGMNTQLGARQYMSDLQSAQAGYQAGRQMQAGATDAFASTISAFGQNMANQGLSDGAFAKTGMKTPGEFDHDSNPIDLVQNGEKIGEATGGEYIFNPEQSKKIKELASKEKSPLGKYVTSLLTKFDKKAK